MKIFSTVLLGLLAPGPGLAYSLTINFSLAAAAGDFLQSQLQIWLNIISALVADSEEKLGRLVSEFGRVCERRKFRVNVGKSKVMRCSRYGNGDRMHVILNGEPLEEVDCFKYLGS